MGAVMIARFNHVLSCALALLAIAAMPAIARGQAQTPTTVTVSGGSKGANQTVPAGEARFGLRVPLKPNAENTLSLVAADADGRTARVDDLKIAQISLSEIVQARVTATRLTTAEVKQLVAEGVIDLDDPDNYHVSRFVVALVVGGKEVHVSVPVKRHKKEPFAPGESVSIGCARKGQGISSTERTIAIPCGNGGSDGPPPPPIIVIPFEAATPLAEMPSVPGVILIEGRIKTLKEFFKVDLLLMNVSSLFTLTELTARLEIPEDALTGIAPAGGSITLSDIGPASETTGQFIVRGDVKGIHTVTAHFGGKINGAFLPEPIAFSGSASTDLEVKGPPKLDVKLTHPDHVVAGQPYDLVVTITNTDDTLDALYTSMAIDVGGDANLLDELSGDEIEGPITRTLGDILRGETVVQTYTVLPKTSGAIVSCVGAADANINLSVQFTGRGPGCAIGTLPSERADPDGRPTVTVVPAHNTADVPVDPAIVALFSTRMIEPTITSGYPGATFNLLDANNNVVSGRVQFTELFEATAAIFRPSSPLAYGQTYTIVVSPTIFNVDGIGLASGIAARFTTGGAPIEPDTVAPTVTLSIEAPLSPQSIGRGQTVTVIADSHDAKGVTRVDLFLDGELIDAKTPSSPVKFLVETATLEAGRSYELTAVAFDTAGNIGRTTLTINIAPDSMAPIVTFTSEAAVGRGQPLPIVVQAIDDGRVAKVEVFVDTASTPAATGLVEPFQFAIQTAALSPGRHSLRIVTTDGAGNASETAHAFDVTGDTTAPAITLVSPQTFTFRTGAPIAFGATATDAGGVVAIAYRLDAEPAPRAIGMSGFVLDTTGLAAGMHAMTVTATDTSGNAATLPVPFELVQGETDTSAPAPANTALITLGPVTGGIVSIAGANGAAEALARVVIVNGTTQANAQAAATSAGAFTAQIEAHGGDILSIVVADSAGNQSPAVAMQVPAPLTLTSIAVSPSQILLNRSLTSQPLVVTGTFSDGSQQVLTTGLAFASSAPTIAGATASGLVIPGQNGAATITVGVTSQAGVAPAAVAVTVDFSSIVGITASPNPLTLHGLGRGEQISVAALYSDDTTGPLSKTVRYATANPDIAIVDTSGRVTSTGIGSTMISVAATGLPPTAVLVVVEAVQPSELLVTPASLAFTSLGESHTLETRFRYNDGTVGSGPFPVTFSSLNGDVATVTAAGTVSATGPGDTSIVVQSLTYTVNIPVSVTLPTTLPPPVITALGRPIAGEGDTLAIVGNDFAGVPGLNIVTIGGVRAEVIGAAFDRVIAVVPVGAASGHVQVRVAGQDSNTMPLNIYPRLARAVLTSAPFEAASAPAGQVAELGSATFYLHPGDEVKLAGDPNTINASTWTQLVGPAFAGMLVLTVDGVEHTFNAAAQPIDLASLLPAVTAPARVTIEARLEATGGTFSSRGLAIVAGPPSTGAFTGQRFLTGDTIAQEMTVRFRVAAPDGTKFAATAARWYRLNGNWHNGSAGGAIVGGDETPNDANFRTFTVRGGEVAVTYSDTGVFADFDSPVTAVVALVPANAAGHRTVTTPVAEARILIGALHSASILPHQTTAIADGVDRAIVAEINSVRDNYGNRVPDGARLAITAGRWYRRSSGNWHNGSAGGTMSGGADTPNDAGFRTYTLADGRALMTYSSAGIEFGTGASQAAILAATVADAAGARLNSHPFAEGAIQLTSPGVNTAIGTPLPTVLSATGGDNRSVVTVSNLTDMSGRPVPDGMRVAVTAGQWYKLNGNWHNASFGGTIVGGEATPNDSRFRTFVASGGQVTFTYSNTGLTLGMGQTSTTVVAVLPADGEGNRIGETPFAEVRITQAGLTSATIVATPASTVADGARRPVAIAVTNIRDALGNAAPDGTSIALTASEWYRLSSGNWSNNSAGGVILDGVATPNDARFRTFTVMNGRVDATFSAESVTPIVVGSPKSSVIAAVVASPQNDDRTTQRPFGEGIVAVSSVATATAIANPASLLADKQDRRATIIISGLTDAQGRPVADGTKVAITAARWYRLNGNCCNSSPGGAMLGGEPTPNGDTDGFRTYTVTGGQVTATYSSAGLFVQRASTDAAILSVLGATPAGDRIGNRPFAAASITLAGLESGTFLAPATIGPGGTVSITLTNIRDTAGNLVPDGTRIAVSAARGYNVNGNWHNGSAGGVIEGGEPTPNHADFRTFTVAGGQVTFAFTAPSTPNVTSVIHAISADGANNRNNELPFVAVSIRVQ